MVELRRVGSWNIEPDTGGTDGESWEVAIDLRRARPDLIEAVVKQSLTQDGGCQRLAPQGWGPRSRSPIWGFNNPYWKAPSPWGQSTRNGYASALPGGDNDARKVE